MTPLASLPIASDAAPDPAGVSRHERELRTESLLVRLADCQDDNESRVLQQEVVLLNIRLADGIAARYLGRGVDRDDLVQVARLGLLKAVLGYRAGMGAGFSAYASPTITGEIKRYFRDQSWMIRPPRRLQRLHSELRSAEPELQHRLHRRPSALELAREVGIEVGELSEALAAAGCYCTISLDLPTRVDSSLSLGDAQPDERDHYQEVERIEWLRPVLAALTDREREIIRMRFVDALSQEQVGKRLGVSQMQVSRLLGVILARLRDELDINDVAATA